MQCKHWRVKREKKMYMYVMYCVCIARMYVCVVWMYAMQMKKKAEIEDEQEVGRSERRKWVGGRGDREVLAMVVQSISCLIFFWQTSNHKVHAQEKGDEQKKEPVMNEKGKRRNPRRGMHEEMEHQSRQGLTFAACGVRRRYRRTRGEAHSTVDRKREEARHTSKVDAKSTRNKPKPKSAPNPQTPRRIQKHTYTHTTPLRLSRSRSRSRSKNVGGGGITSNAHNHTTETPVM
ncbi:hypothetical protein BDZ97DRAFT_619870 [Flammula alnicola]|nr:hypothetical protein BDZ97DRAFT_619870 [Flammula alnicola]